MRTTITIEFTDEELKRHVADVARRAGLGFIHDLIQHASGFKIDPSVLQAVATAFSSGVAAVSDPGPTAPATPASKINADYEERKYCISNGSEWFCCKCDTFNLIARTTCRACAHLRCDVAPPLSPEEPNPKA